MASVSLVVLDRWNEFSDAPFLAECRGLTGVSW